MVVGRAMGGVGGGDGSVVVVSADLDVRRVGMVATRAARRGFEQE